MFCLCLLLFLLCNVLTGYLQINTSILFHLHGGNLKNTTYQDQTASNNVVSSVSTGGLDPGSGFRGCAPAPETVYSSILSLIVSFVIILVGCTHC